MKFASALLSVALMAGSAMADSKKKTTTSSVAPTSTAPATYTPTPVNTNNVFGWERLDKNDSVLVILDLQEGLFSIARDWGTPSPSSLRHQLVANLL